MPARRLPFVRLFTVLGAVLGTMLVLAGPAWATSPNVVISQVYGGGGNTGAPYTERLHRAAQPEYERDLDHRLVGAVRERHRHRELQLWRDVALGRPGSGPVLPRPGGPPAPATGSPLPMPNASGTIAMSATAGKVVLVNSTTGLACNGGSTPCSAAQLAQILDLVGYGNANFFEGPGAAPTLSNTTSGLRSDQGCQDTDNNAADLTAGAPIPRNLISAFHVCTSDDAPSVASTTPTNSATGVAVDADVSLTFSEPVNVTGSWYSISCGVSGTHTAIASGGPTSFTLEPGRRLRQRRDLHGHRLGRERQRPGHERPARQHGGGLRLQLHHGRRAPGRRQPGLRRRRQLGGTPHERLRRALQPRTRFPSASTAGRFSTRRRQARRGRSRA